MELPRVPPGDAVHAIARAIVPLAGALFLGWSAGNLLFVYCADTLASMYAVCVLASARLFAFERARGPAWLARLVHGVQLALTALMPFVAMALPIAITMGIVLAVAGFDWRNALHDHELRLALAAQFGAAVWLLLRDYDVMLVAPDADRRIKARFGLVFLRWAIVLIAAFSVLAALPFYGIALVLVCSLAQAALELYPNHILRGFGAADLAEPAPGAAPGGSEFARAATGAHARRRHARRRRG